MIIAVIKFKLYLTNKPSNLKEKRIIVNSLKDKVFKKFNVSIAEVDDYNSLHLTTIGISVVSNEIDFLYKVSSKIYDFFLNYKDISIIDYYCDYLSGF
ncbi:MAG: DUF503 domain-containing protein [bacterium]|nr:DUF503 domain-containing protein [bacterium]